MDEAEAKLATKLSLSRITGKRTKSILDTGLTEAIERHQAALKIITAEVDQLQREIEAHKIADKQEAKVIDIWNTKIEAEMANIWRSGWRSREYNAKTQEREEWIKFEFKLRADLQAKSTQQNRQVEISIYKPNYQCL